MEYVLIKTGVFGETIGRLSLYRLMKRLSPKYVFFLQNNKLNVVGQDWWF